MTHLTAELSVIWVEHQVVSSCTVYLADSAVLFASEFSRNVTHRNEPGGPYDHSKAAKIEFRATKRGKGGCEGVVRFELTNRMSNPMERIVN